jgi:hypothetical protein
MVGPGGAGEGAGLRADEEVHMVGQEGLGGDGEGAGVRKRGQAGDEILPVGVIPENDAPLPTPHYHVVESVRGIHASLARHDGPEAITMYTTCHVLPLLL